jgi:serine phosphatase RsbU (regulator of sigma subunit)
VADGDLDLRGLLAAVESAPPVDAVDVLAVELARMVDATEVSLLIANFSGTAVVRMSHVHVDADQRDGRSERTESLVLDGSPYQGVLASQELRLVRDDAGSWVALVPVTERGDALGVLELRMPQHPDPDTVEYLIGAAHALAYVIIASRRHTDLFEWAQRDVQFTLAAEMQRRLLPSSYTVEGGAFTIAGWLEPAAQVGGDTFDYAIDRDYLYVSITDAMGHMNQAALLATLTVGSLRNTRRSIASPAEQADTANRALLDEARSDQFVSGHILRIGLADGVAEIVNAGHPQPYLLRGGRATRLEITPNLPLGVDWHPYVSQLVPLQPGDRMLLVTDGFLERNAVTVGIADAMEASASLHPREVVRELAQRVLLATGGNLRDDATVVCIDWFGGDGHRTAIGGASRDRASV